MLSIKWDQGASDCASRRGARGDGFQGEDGDGRSQSNLSAERRSCRISKRVAQREDEVASVSSSRVVESRDGGVMGLSGL